MLFLHIKVIWLLPSRRVAFLHVHNSPGVTLTQMINGCWPRLCWYIKQQQQRNACNSCEEAHIEPIVSLLRLIFTVLHISFCSFHNPVICGLQTGQHTYAGCEHDCTCRQVIKSDLSALPPFVFVAGKRTSNSTQLIKVCAHRVSEGRVGGVALWFSTSSFSSFLTVQIYTVTNPVEGRRGFMWHIQ